MGAPTKKHRSLYDFLCASCRINYIVVTFTMGLTMMLVMNAVLDANDPELTSPLATTAFPKPKPLEPNKIILGMHKHEAYYHCAAKQPGLLSGFGTKKKIQHIVLLHGSSYTKEDWKTSGIMQQLCDIDRYAVTALDLSHQSTSKPLINMLNDLHEQGLITSLPLAAIVTPSASGLAVVDWINKDPGRYVKSVQLWVPIASPAVTKLQKSRMKELKSRHVPILAIYGDKDAFQGKERSELLRDKVGAEVVRIKGKHACYLDSPDVFVEALTTRLDSIALKEDGQ